MTRTEQILQLAKFSVADTTARYMQRGCTAEQSVNRTHGEKNRNTRLAPLISALAEENEKLRAALEKNKLFQDHILGKEKRVDWGKTFDMNWVLVNDTLISTTQALNTSPLDALLQGEK